MVKINSKANLVCKIIYRLFILVVPCCVSIFSHAVNEAIVQSDLSIEMPVIRVGDNHYSVTFTYDGNFVVSRAGETDSPPPGLDGVDLATGEFNFDTGKLDLFCLLYQGLEYRATFDLISEEAGATTFNLSSAEEIPGCEDLRVPANPEYLTTASDQVTIWSDNLIIVELGADGLLPENHFDLEGKTLRFTPDGIGYRTEVVPLEWDSDFGTVIVGFPSIPVTLNNFQFPFSGTNWSTLFVNNFGSISFGEDQDSFYDQGNFDFRDYSLINRVPIISPLFHKFGGTGWAHDPDDVNRIFIKELSDRIVITWTISEPYRGVVDFITDPLLNRFQAVLHEDGTIVLSYDKISVKDGIVGVFTIGSDEQVLVTLTDPEDPALPGHIDLLSVTFSLIGSRSIRIGFRTRGAVLPEGDPTINLMSYRLLVDLEEPFFEGERFEDAEFQWGIEGSSDLTYSTNGPGVTPKVEIDGDTISLIASIGALAGVDHFAIWVDVVDFDGPDDQGFDQTDNIPVTFPDLPSIEIDLSETSIADPANDVPFEAFHYPDILDESVLTCSVIAALGDQFDLFAFYTDFQLDTQGAGAGGSGPIGGSVTGVNPANPRAPEQYCSNRIQVFQGPVAIDTPVSAPAGLYRDGPFENYAPAVSLLSHELGHRWLTVKEAIVGGNTVAIGDGAPHWLEGLHAPSAFPIAEPFETSIMGAGKFWTDNGDGTFTFEQIDFNSVTSAYSYLDLYLMGLLPQDDVPDFFLIQNLAHVGFDSNNKPIYSGDRLDITVEDVIAANGPRLPAFETSKKDFNLGLIGIVLPGAAPSPMLLKRLAGIREAFSDYWSRATGEVSTMTVPVLSE